MQNTNFFTVRQHVKLFPKTCCACPPCVKQENTYSIYAGLNQDSQAEFLRVDEVSDDWNRCCCAPYHPVKVRPPPPTPPSLVAAHCQLFPYCAFRTARGPPVRARAR